MPEVPLAWSFIHDRREVAFPYLGDIAKAVTPEPTLMVVAVHEVEAP
jgi:hypothetical protein